MPRLSTFDSLRTPAYRVYYASMAGHWAVASMQMMVRSLLVYRITDSAAAIGAIALAQSMPSLLVSFFGGTYADRIQKKYLLIYGRVGITLSTLGVAFALSTGYLSQEHPEAWWILIACAIAQGIATGFTQPALMAIIPEIVGKDRVMNAISLSTTGQYVFRLVGPAVAGFLIDGYGFGTVYYLMAALYGLATLGSIFLPRSGEIKRSTRSALGDTMQGMQYLKRETVILLIVIFSLLHVICGQPYIQLMPVFTDSILKVGASGLGILTTVSAAGAVAGSLVLSSLPNKKRGLLLLLSGVFMGVGVGIFAHSQWWVLSLAMMPIIGLGPSMHTTMTATLVQSYVEPNYRGRMQSFVSMSSGVASLGTFFAGITADKIGVQWAVGGMGILLALISILFIAFAAKLRKMD